MTTAPSPTIAADTPPLRVLIVDDHPVVAEGWERITRGRLDCEVISAATPSQAWRAWRREAPDLIVADLTMGDSKLAGIRLIQRLRAAKEGGEAHRLTMQVFNLWTRRLGYVPPPPWPTPSPFRRPARGAQLGLFGAA